MDNISKAWNWDIVNDKRWYIPSEDSYYLINRWQQKGFKTFLDLGCGRGRHSIQFAKFGFEVSSIDLSKTAVNSLKALAKEKNINVTAKVSDMCNLPFEDNSFDCLLAYHVISHTDSKGIKRILKEIRRVLKEDGEFYITFCSKNSYSFKDAGYPKLDENTIVKIENGPENNVPHFYVDDNSIKKLLRDFRLITVRQIQEVVREGHDFVSWHYFVLGKK